MVDHRGEMDDDLDEPMASQSVDSEAPLTHNSSKNNFFASPDETPSGPMIGQQQPPRGGSFKNAAQAAGKFNPQYMKGSPNQRNSGKRSQTPDHLINEQGGVEMKPLHQVQTGAGNVHSPSVAQKVSRMGVPTPFAGVTSVPSPIR